ncbi:MAG: sterol desaturase family protein [Flavobacteriales bacterium]|nr:sterol desaturase family protein [Flavobacteriales bacterium]MBK6943581.1 sterol desaturase family protein [Flavobacteriales bacterium]MBK7240544.1 sterol desaturase family protein [Flavobacteriales bacterium]MBK7297215.1 sterol desaturase family protein [Flavobacteriales bacterium]MBK9535891.1 sterol desaturase family protein [Flavobacteriales bacterium]
MDYIVYSIPVFLVLILIELGWSAWSGNKVYRFNDLISNIGCGIGSQVVGAFTKTTIFTAYLWTYDNWRLFTIENSILTWIVAFLLVDLLYYWFHRLSHEVNFLWAAHIVHHQSEEYNLSVALRQSWWQGLFSWWFYVPMAIMGIHPLMIVTVAAFNTLYQFWIHTKAISTLGPLEFIFNTPAHHRVHHGSDPKYIDRNHAGTLIIWDKLFGTFQQEEEEPVYGITEQLGSWDPVKANFHYWGDLGVLAGQCNNWWDKVRVFLKPPGWRPLQLGGFQGPKKKDRATYQKFDTVTARAMAIYVLVQFIFLLGATSFFLFQQDQLRTWQQWAFSALIVLWVMDLGLLLEGSRIANWLEVLRIAALALLLLSCGNMFPDPITFGLNGGIVLVSLAMLWLGIRNRSKITWINKVKALGSSP